MEDSIFEFLGILLVPLIIMAIIQIVGLWKIFEKAGEPGWASIVPVYNAYILIKIVGKPGYWLFLCMIPFINLIFVIWIINMLSKSFGKDEGFTIGLILLGFIFYPILGFGPARYLGPYGDPPRFAAMQNQQFDFEKTH